MNSGNDKARLLLEKTHLPRTFYFTTKFSPASEWLRRRLYCERTRELNSLAAAMCYSFE
jgi:hypothetical protein